MASAPFTTFNFSVEITREDNPKPLADAAFSECDGLEITMESKTIREGGNNGRQIRLAGGLAFGQLTLKRGLTQGFDLWHWLNDSLRNPSLRASAEVVLFDATHQPTARFLLERCLPIKLKAPALNAKDGLLAVEELQLVYESLEWRQP